MCIVVLVTWRDTKNEEGVGTVEPEVSFPKVGFFIIRL